MIIPSLNVFFSRLWIRIAQMGENPVVFCNLFLQYRIFDKLECPEDSNYLIKSTRVRASERYSTGFQIFLTADY